MFLRRAVAREVGADPAELRFAYSESGKPSLPDGPRFSLAHSDAHALLALSMGADVGADLELVRPDVAEPSVAESFFSPAEQATLAALPPPERLRRFFDLWTLKEAYLKATGAGITPPGALAELPAGGWVAERPPVPDGYAAAVVALVEEATFSFGSWSA